MVEKRCKPIERIEGRPGDQIGPDEAEKLKRNRIKDAKEKRNN